MRARGRSRTRRLWAESEGVTNGRGFANASANRYVRGDFPTPTKTRRGFPAMAVQYTYVMKGLTKTFPGASKPVLNNIHLQFLPSAKIALRVRQKIGRAHV